MAGCESHAVSTVSESQRGAVWFPRASGCDITSEVSVLESGGRENDAAITVSESRGLPDIAEDAVLETCVRESDPVLTVSESSRSWKDAALETCGRENFAVLTVSQSSPSVKAGENGECGLLEVIESDFSSPLTDFKSLLNSSHVSSNVGCTSLALLPAPACALAACTHGFCSAPSSAVVPLCMHVGDTCACIISWSDTGRVTGPTGRRCTKGGVSGPAEDLRPVPEVEAGVNFRPAGRVRGQVAGSLPGSVVTPSLHPEVPGLQFVSLGRGLGIRQSMGWTKVCGTAQSGIWVLKGDARTCRFPANLDHLRVEWRKQGS